MDDRDLEHARNHWRLRGQARPAGAVQPGPGQESVWDYPRPPVIVADSRHIQVRLHNILIAETETARRVLETASPPTFYLPPGSIQCDCLQPATASSFCEWKGQAAYFNICTAEHRVKHAAWCYADPFPEFVEIRHYLAFYPNLLDCYVDGERVQAQTGGFYGGWITDEIVGPFKGEPGTSGW